MVDQVTLRIVFTRFDGKHYTEEAPYRDAIEVPVGTSDVDIVRLEDERFAQVLEQLEQPPAPSIDEQPPTTSNLRVRVKELVESVRSQQESLNATISQLEELADIPDPMNEVEILDVVQQVIEENPHRADKAAKLNEKALQYLVEEVDRKTDGRSDSEIAEVLLRQELYDAPVRQAP